MPWTSGQIVVVSELVKTEEQETTTQSESHSSDVGKEGLRQSKTRQRKENSVRSGQTTRLTQLSQKQSSQLERISRSIEKQAQLSKQLKSSIDKIKQQLDRIERTNLTVVDWVSRKKAKKDKKKRKNK
jgi:hypothetical protein